MAGQNNCRRCRGTGKDPMGFGAPCEVCGGTGVTGGIPQKTVKSSKSTLIKCVRCRGSGKDPYAFGAPCEVCKGTGVNRV